MISHGKNPISRFNDLSFRKKLFVSYAIIVLIPVAIIMFIINSLTQEKWIEQAERNLLIQIDEYVERIEQRIQQHELSLSLFALNQQISTILQTEYKDFYGFVKEYTDNIFPSFTTIKSLRPSLRGWTLYTTGPLQKYRSFARPIMELASNPIYRDIVTSRSIVWYSDGTFICQGIRQTGFFMKNQINIIVFYYLLEDVFEDIELVNIKHAVQVMDGRGSVVFENDLARTIPVSKSINYPEEIMRNVQYGTGNFLIVSKSLNFSGWSLRYFVPVSVLEQGKNSQLIGLLLLLMSITVMLIILIFFISKNLIHRLEALNKCVKTIVNTGTVQELHAEEKDEIGELSNSVATMIEESQRMTHLMYDNKLALQEAEFSVLQMQIKPHFLYNSLSLINWCAIRNNDHEISKIALMLSQFYRTMLNQGQNITSVREEWMNMEAYLHIQLIFHNNKFKTDLFLDESIAQCMIPHLLLQPLVENAIEHGIDKLRDGSGILNVSVKRKETLIRIEITDNGPGFSSESLHTALTNNSKSYGIKNINDRLKLLYKDYRFELSNIFESGAMVIVEIPMSGPIVQRVSDV